MVDPTKGPDKQRVVGGVVRQAAVGEIAAGMERLSRGVSRRVEPLDQPVEAEFTNPEAAAVPGDAEGIKWQGDSTAADCLKGRVDPLNHRTGRRTCLPGTPDVLAVERHVFRSGR